jgi:hypothetical protein
MGLIGKIFAVLGVIILIFLIIAGITVYQGYKVYKVMQAEQAKMQANADALKADIENKKFGYEDCARLIDIESSAGNIKQEMNSACKNPIIRIGVEKSMANKPIQTSTGTITVSCGNLDEIYAQSVSTMKPLRDICENQTMMDEIIKSQQKTTISQNASQ